MESLSAHRNRMRVSIDYKITDFKARLVGLLRRSPAKLGAYPRKKLRHAERLCQVVIGALIERLHFHGIRIANAEHNDRSSIKSGAQPV